MLGLAHGNFKGMHWGSSIVTGWERPTKMDANLGDRGIYEQGDL